MAHRRRLTPRVAGMLVAAAVITASCGQTTSSIDSSTAPAATTHVDTSAGLPTTSPPAHYQVTATVLESPEHGPQLCAGVLDSYPPQCTGADIVGFDWMNAPGVTSANGTTWGSYTLVGTWDGTALTLTAPPLPGSQTGPSEPTVPDFLTPCPEPSGGWAVTDPALVSMASYEGVSAAAQAQSDIGGMWVDQSINPAGAVNDFSKMVLNVSFTGDLDRHERELRALWGGPLCVSKAAISAQALADRRTDVERVVGSFLTSSADERAGTIEIQVFLDDRGLQGQFDNEYGTGAVRITSLLQPTTN